MNKPDEQTFTCDFGNGITCTVKSEKHLPTSGDGGRHIVWSGTPTKKVLRAYVAWMNSVNQQLADHWGVSLSHIFQVHKDWMEAEVWEYRPGERPKLAGKLREVMP